MKFDTKRDIKRLLGVLTGATLLALNLKTFVSAGGLFPGGATGLTVLLQRIALRYFDLSLPYSVLNIIINVIPVYIGFRYVGKKFTILSLIMILFTGIVTDSVHLQPIAFDFCFRRNSKRLCDYSLPDDGCHLRRNGFYCYLFIPEKRGRYLESNFLF